MTVNEGPVARFIDLARPAGLLIHMISCDVVAEVQYHVSHTVARRAIDRSEGFQIGYRSIFSRFHAGESSDSSHQKLIASGLHTDGDRTDGCLVAVLHFVTNQRKMVVPQQFSVKFILRLCIVSKGGQAEKLQ